VKAFVIYDSGYGNTEALARGIGEAAGGDVEVVRADQVDPSALRTAGLLIVGSPTQGGRPTAAVNKFLDKIPAGALRGISVATFDTRIAATDQGIGLRALMRVIGYAAPRIASSLRAKGGQLAAEPEGFIVNDKEGPLKDGELDRARAWTKAILGTIG
jgi:flavodoxin I